MILVDIIAWILFTFLVYIAIYRFVIVLNSSRGRMTDIAKREYQPKIERKLTVLIYSRNDSAKAKALVESFSKQNYSKEKFSLHVILDNCDNENIKLLEIIGGTRLWRINTDIKPIGKYKAFAWLLERLRALENTNAFVFLDAECIIKTDFLEKINANLNEECVIAGETIKRKKFFFNKIINLGNKITNRVIRHGRFYSSLCNIIDTDILVIRQDILEKIEFEINDWGYEEFEYPIKLKYFNIPVLYSSEITVHKNIAETLKDISHKMFQNRYRAFKTFKNNFNVLFSKNKLLVKEQVLSLIYPSGTTFALLGIVLLYISLNFPFTGFSQIINTNIVLLLLLSRFASDIHCLISMRSNLYDYYNAALLFVISPVLYVVSWFTGFYLPITKTKKRKKSEESIIPVSNFEKTTVDATITNGKSEFPCKLEVNKSDENSSVTFIFKNKKLSSSKQPRTCYAVDEIIEKLKAHGFSLKVCANCGYFHLTESTAAHTGGEQGYCLYKNYKEDSKEKEFTPAWNSCKKIIPSQARNHIRKEMGLEKK